MNMEKSRLLFEKSKNFIPGGVNSPVRAYKSVGMTPPFIKSAKGSRIIDMDENEYIDYVGSWGPMILGHAHPEVVEEIKKACEDGTSYGAPTHKELILAEMIINAVPSVEMVRMVSSGTEAVMSSVRVARGFTGRDKILKFEGCYHGHSDGLLAKAGSGALTTGVPDSAGVPSDYVKNTIIAEYNNFDELENVFKSHANELAAVIVEPVAGNMGVVLPEKGFLELIRELTLKHGVVLIFDEVITGFRVSYGGAQGHFGIAPDMTVFGKIVGGGMPVGAYGGRKDIISMVSPVGPVYQAGTLSGNPVAMAAGIKTLEILRDNQCIYKKIEENAKELEKSFLDASRKFGIPLKVNRMGSLLSAFFTVENVVDLRTAMTCDVGRFRSYFQNMLQSGIYIAPSQFEAIFVSNAHEKEDITKTINAVNYAFSRLQQ
ncbi:glutamate-1-semialdehyde 2,1-aminomutase [Pseudobacteroides cellulosolvens]|uniref:Glutamate-1-semialdehyde 2,1-aminomutase n=1 Tax=Pseudobacteroides cellulosolvens ATCC 35603 = DSM 2933 TaxID=398512 RepID=A0A0L6JRI0_9FIRM|nr:glutamate-1-semialdehyde 2,1-aminomutase [Pseudobacteroides cellulosolvens]KNY28002.1 Glutamate-1-semialdehyde 2,1-aminomutase [Pseudobacteroides cellulosolvens ATCC 35603 = DSM 2933]